MGIFRPDNNITEDVEKKNCLHAFFFSPPTRKLAARSLLKGNTPLALINLNCSKNLSYHTSLISLWSFISASMM